MDCIRQILRRFLGRSPAHADNQSEGNRQDVSCSEWPEVSVRHRCSLLIGLANGLEFLLTNMRQHRYRIVRRERQLCDAHVVLDTAEAEQVCAVFQPTAVCRFGQPAEHGSVDENAFSGNWQTTGVHVK